MTTTFTHCVSVSIRILMVCFICLASFSGHSQINQQIDDLGSKQKENEAEALRLRQEIAKLQHSMTSGKFIDTTQAIIYNFKQPQGYLKSNVRPKIGEPIVFRIININRLAYEVSIKSQDVAVADENFNPEFNIIIGSESQAGSIKIPEQKKIDIPMLATLSRKPVSGKAELTKAQAEEIETVKLPQLDNLIRSIILDLEENNKKLSDLENNPLLQTDENLKKEYAKAKKLDVKLRNDWSIQHYKFESEKKKLENYRASDLAISENMEILNIKYGTLLKNLKDIKDIAEQYNRYKSQALNPRLTWQQYKSIDSTYSNLLSDNSEMKSVITIFESELDSFYAKYNQAVNDWESFVNLEENAREIVLLKYQLMKEEVDKIKAVFQELDLKNKLIKAKAMSVILLDKDSYTITSSPIQPFEDYVVFDVNIKHRDGMTAEYDDDREFKYMEYTQGGVRFDFSTGVVFDFPLDKNDNDHNDYFDEYEVVDVIDPSGNPKKQIQGISRNDFIPSLAGMFHMSFRRSGNYAFGLTLGASLNVETFELNSLFPGLSFLIGKKQKFAITAGPSFRQRDILKRNYSLKAYYEPDEFGSGTEVTSKQFKVGFFFGITYNLTQKQRGKFKISGAQTEGGE